MEPRENIIAVCPDCTKKQKEKAQKHLEQLNAASYIKTCFFDSVKKAEHMWVEIKKVCWDEKMILGLLANDPIIATDLKCGQRVAIPFSEIEDYL